MTLRRVLFRIATCVALTLMMSGADHAFLTGRPGEFTVGDSTDKLIAPPGASSARYKIDADQSRFFVKAFAGGVFSAFAHDHTIAIRDFGGHVDFTFGTVEPASLEITIKAGSLEVTDKVSASDRQKIEGTMRDEVLEISKYPEIVFKSTGVNATKTGEGLYQARISGELILHGVTRPLNISSQLEFGNGNLRAKGSFSIKMTTFNLKPVSIGGGTIKVKDELKFTFDVFCHS